MSDRIKKILLDIVEFYVPSVFFAILFLSFIIGIFFRYIVRNPQSWTFEISTIAFVCFTFLSTSLPNRTGEHVVFDLFYNKMPERRKNISRIISELLIIIMAAILVKPAIEYLVSFSGLKTQITNIPRFLVFISFPIMLVDTIIINLVFLIRDIKALKTAGGEVK